MSPGLRCASVLVVLAAACSGGLHTRLCGAVDQPCCAELPACDDGARCNATSVCEACGATGQGCCADNACQAGLTCSGSVCAEPLVCTTQCTLGTTRCSATGGVESCGSDGTCPAWRSVVATCPTGTVCTNGDCVEQCPTACVPDTLQCTVQGLQRCVQPTGQACPSLMMAADSDPPTCMLGAAVGTDLVWESPTPFHAPLAGIAGDLVSSYWLLDGLGNIVHLGPAGLEYEVRGVAGKRARAIASCGLGSRLFAVGEGGTVYRRGYGGWTEENVGAAVTLEAVACDSNQMAVATGGDGKLYRSGTPGWSNYPTGSSGPFHGLGYNFSTQQVFLVGNGGAITRCTGLDQPTPACAADPSGSTADLAAAWGDPFNSQIFAVGANGTVLQRGTSSAWTALDSGGATESLQAVAGYLEPSTNTTVVIAAGASGAYLARPYALSFFENVVAAETLTGVMAIDKNNVFLTSREGTLWYTDQVSPLPTTPFTALGGQKPIAATLNAVSGLGLGKVFAVGEGGARYRRVNGGWLPDTGGLGVTQALTGVAAVSAGEVYAVGLGGRLLVRRYGTWSDDAPGLTAVDLQAVAADTQRTVAVGANGTWLEKPRAGAWQAVAQTATTRGLYALAMNRDASGAATEVIAVGEGCTVVSKVGETFSLVPGAQCPGGTTLRAATFTSAGELYLGGTGGVILKRTASGFVREYLDAVTQETVRGLTAQGSSVWAMTEQGGLFRRTTAWGAFQPDLTTSDLLAGWNDQDEGLFIVGGQGLVWRKP